ncbi:CRISPR-associated protein Cas1 [Desulfurococcus mucosus DSM 2162]|uniref:CRISPR-associated endonuclease Cas1 n=1 Tax=Desulfurococcus mucosus (strain ATCC 35584 / DSM 2162 / JCM 9187 / O7/1) TaxID=765177 RepID=E8R9W5_DESM0|nr:CRISPR-associated endonuclease Cas1 [Desulfurococcus mucosus]ADV65291.1 CRISPR-associated protein Cas1 [Desulfurococcus mucosus DSM 2162]
MPRLVNGYLLVDEYGAFLGKKHGRVVVRVGGSREEYALKLIRDVVVAGRASISSELLKAMAYSGVGLLVTSYTGTPLARLIPARAGGTFRNRVEQYKALEDGRACIIARDLITGKVKNQSSNIKYYSKARAQESEKKALYEKALLLDGLIKQLSTYTPGTGRLEECREKVLSVEAQAAEIYWDGMRVVLGDYGFERRVKIPEAEDKQLDTVNTALNIVYNILAGNMWKYVLRFGLDPYAGFLHAERPGRLSLVYDLIEPFRPLGDRLIASLLRRGVLRPGMQGKEVAIALRSAAYSELTEQEMKYKGRKVKLEASMFLLAEEVVSMLTGRRSSVSTPFLLW